MIVSVVYIFELLFEFFPEVYDVVILYCCFCLFLSYCHSFSVWFILFAVKSNVMLSFGTTLLFIFCFFVFRVKLLLWIKLIVYTFEFDDRANYNVANFLMFRFNLLLLTSMFLNVIVFGTNNVAKAIMLLVLRYRWIEPSKSIATVFDHNFIKLFMYSACLLKCMT